MGANCKNVAADYLSWIWGIMPSRNRRALLCYVIFCLSLHIINRAVICCSFVLSLLCHVELSEKRLRLKMPYEDAETVVDLCRRCHRSGKCHGHAPSSSSCVRGHKFWHAVVTGSGARTGTATGIELEALYLWAQLLPSFSSCRAQKTRSDEWVCLFGVSLMWRESRDHIPSLRARYTGAYNSPNSQNFNLFLMPCHEYIGNGK